MDEIKYSIQGNDMQYVEVDLAPGQSIVAEAGTILYMGDGIKYDAKLSDGSDADTGLMGQLFSAGKRLLTQASLFLSHFTNNSTVSQKIAFSEPYPGKILPFKLSDYNGKLVCQKDSFLCASPGTKISIEWAKKFGAGLFGGSGFILQKIQGKQSLFIHACGDIIKKELKNEKLLVEAGTLVAFSDGIQYDIQRAGDLKTMFFGGSGLFFAALSGTGTVWLQSISFNSLARRVVSEAGSIRK